MRLFDKLLGREATQPELLLTPEMEVQGHRLDNCALGMTRQSDHVTSVAAAAVVERSLEPLRARVLRFAKDAGPGGFIDEELQAIEPGRPESSFRKRRTELAEKNWIVEAGFIRRNSHRQDSKVWVHRDFAHNPPDLVSAPKKRKVTADRARAEEHEAVVQYLNRPENRILLGATLADRIKEGLHRPAAQ